LPEIQIQMSKKSSFILNDESLVNSHGFILLNSGADLERFKSNPVMLHSHREEQVIGSWDNVRVEGSKLMADPVFDTEDDDAKKIQGKVERGFLKGASLGINIKTAELRDIPSVGLVAAVTSWEVLEASIVAVPSNSMSLRLYNEKGERITSSEAIKLSIDNLINKSKPETQMEKILLTAEAATALNISKEPEAAALNAAIIALSVAKDKAENELKTHLTAQAKALVEGAITEGRLTADKRDSFEKLAISDFKQVKDLIDALPAKQTFSDKTRKGGAAMGDRDDWNYLKWAKEDPSGLATMQANDPEKFAQLKAAYKSKR
jgi:hypothetical protein